MGERERQEMRHGRERETRDEAWERERDKR